MNIYGLFLQVAIDRDTELSKTQRPNLYPFS